MKICPNCKTQYEGGEVFCPVDAARLVSGSQLESGIPIDHYIGATIDRYKILRRVGEGGMGVVYEAMHTVIEKRVAIKLLRKDFSSRPDVVERFRQEAKSASRIGHEHIVDISDFGETLEGDSYFVMEFLEGRDLANLLGVQGVVERKRAIDIVVQCCRALGAAHGKGIVHRDMKPENIFLVRRDDNPDFVKIVDFGIAKMNEIETQGEPGRKLTQTGMIFGTPEYMSPEQAAGRPVDHRVDIYALGVILFELLLGRVPFVGDAFMAILTQHMFDPIPVFGDVNSSVLVPHDVEAVIRKALAKKPDDRFQTMEQFADALSSVGESRLSSSTLVGVSRSVVNETAPSESRTVTSLRFDEDDAAPSLARGSTSDVASTPKRRLPLIASSVALLALVCGLGYAGYAKYAAKPEVESVALALDAGAQLPAEPDASMVFSEDEVDTLVGAAEPDAGELVDSSAPEAPLIVDLLVETRPSGAEVLVVGSDSRCEPSPCSIPARVGEAIKLRGVSGRATGELELTPTQAMAVVIPLSTTSRPSRASTDSSTSRSTTMNRTSGDLRIPDIFR